MRPHDGQALDPWSHAHSLLWKSWLWQCRAWEFLFPDWGGPETRLTNFLTLLGRSLAHETGTNAGSFLNVISCWRRSSGCPRELSRSARKARLCCPRDLVKPSEPWQPRLRRKTNFNPSWCCNCRDFPSTLLTGPSLSGTLSRFSFLSHSECSWICQSRVIARVLVCPCVFLKRRFRYLRHISQFHLLTTVGPA